MATIILTSYMVRHPLGGVLWSNFQLIWGFTRLGHEVYVFEPAGYPKSCFDPVRYESGDDCGTGMAVTGRLMDETVAPGRLCFVDAAGRHHGLDREQLLAVFSRCDLFIDRGDHRSWVEESARVPVRVLLDPDPGYRQIKQFQELAGGGALPHYDAYYTYGWNLTNGSSPAPTLGLRWRHLFHPVDTERIAAVAPRPGAPFTTVMNWTSHKPVHYGGRSYGMKDVEFERFLGLPGRSGATLEVAVEGNQVSRDRLEANGWRVRRAVEVTATVDSYLHYIRGSAGEFSVLKEVYRALRVGWLGDRSATYLALGRPVVVQDNGLAGSLPLTEGLFAVDSVDEAAAAIERIRSDPWRQARAAREIAVGYLDTGRVLGRFLAELGLPVRGDLATV